MQRFELQSEAAVHARYLTVYNRKVRFHADGGDPTDVSVCCVCFQVLGAAGWGGEALPRRSSQHHHTLWPHPTLHPLHPRRATCWSLMSSATHVPTSASPSPFPSTPTPTAARAAR
jgi:hypothetical protein